MVMWIYPHQEHSNMVRLPQGFLASNSAISKLSDHTGFLSIKPQGFPAGDRTVSVLSDAHQRRCVIVNETKVSHH